MTERTYTTEEAARRLGVPANTVAKWKQRGLVVPAGYLRGRGHGVPLYYLEDLMPLAKAWRPRARHAPAHRRRAPP